MCQHKAPYQHSERAVRNPQKPKRGQRCLKWWVLMGLAVFLGGEVVLGCVLGWVGVLSQAAGVAGVLSQAADVLSQAAQRSGLGQPLGARRSGLGQPLPLGSSRLGSS